MNICSNDLLPQLVRAWAMCDPNRPFLQEVDGPAQTYGETHSESLAWARALRARGINAGNRVVVFMPPKLETINIWIGLGWLSAMTVPVNTEYRGSMLRYVLENSKARILICAERYLEAVVEILPEIPQLREVMVWRETSAPLPAVTNDVSFVGIDEVLSENVGDDDFTGDGPFPHEISSLMYTSGTTGPSKGVMIPWGSVANAGRRAGPPGGFRPEDVFYSTLPMYHVGGTNWLHGLANAGGTWVFRERLSTSSFWGDVRRYSCTTTFLLGAMANFLSRADELTNDSDNPMRTIVAVPLPEDVTRFERRFGLKTFTVYGSTEIGIAMKSLPVRVDNRSCGQPFPEYEMRVVDEFDNEVPHGEVGELTMRPLVPWISFNGYFAMPEATAAAWRNLWFHSGDAFRRDAAGNFYFVDRIKDSIRRRGENISSAEVEAFVLRNDDVLECAAIPVPSEWGEDEVKVYVALKEGRDLTEERLIAYLRSESMPKFMVPRFIELVDVLPKTPTGKIQKQVLRTESAVNRGWDRDADPGRALASPSHFNPVERGQ